MRKIPTIICALIIALLIPAAALVSERLPANSRPYVEKKYAGWNGVLQAWICCRWSPGGSFIRWLNACAAEFEKKHEGIYIEFTPVTEHAMRTMDESGIRKPDMILFSPGVITDESGLTQLSMPNSLRSEFSGMNRSLPVAMGGYIWAYNRALTDSPPSCTNASALTIPGCDGGRCFPAALAALMSGDDTSSDMALPEAGIDLGLEANADVPGFTDYAEAMDAFLSGEIAYLPVTQSEIGRLIRLRESGRGPDWACAASGDFAWADQLLLLSVPLASDLQAGERAALSSGFAAVLLSPASQERLADVGAFSTSGETIHSAFSGYAELDGFLASRPLAIPDIFSEHSAADGAQIIRRLCARLISPEEALQGMGLEFSLQDHPN